ncbi:MAG: hypothetical protein ABI321_23485 [Polyangia bacterium]
MIRVLILTLALTACHEAPFHAPAQPDLYKVPYDFGARSDAEVASVDLSAHEEAHHDLSTPHEDLATEHD